MDRETRRQIVQALIPFMGDNDARRNIIETAWSEAPNLKMQVNYSGAAHVFVGNLLTTAERYGTIEGRRAVLYLLDEVEVMVGGDAKADITKIKAKLGDPGVTPPAPSNPATPAQSNGGSGQTFNMGNVSGGMVNVGGTVNVYGNAASVPNPPASSGSGASASPAPSGPVTRDQVFISYSHRETEWMKRLMTSLKPRMRFGGISVWNDENIGVGDKWRDEINTALAKTRVAVLMVSTDFLASSFIMDKEVPVILKAAEKNLVRVVWVPLTFSAVKHTPINEYQAAGTPLLSPNSPLNSLENAAQNQALEKVADQIMDEYKKFDA